jgi:hypothetical protein
VPRPVSAVWNTAWRFAASSPNGRTRSIHWGLGLLTPTMVHHGQAAAVLAARQTVLTAAYAAHPERFVGQPPRAGVAKRSLYPPSGRQAGTPYATTPARH